MTSPMESQLAERLGQLRRENRFRDPRVLAAAPAAGLAGSGLAVLPLGAADFSGLLSVLTVPLGLAVFLVVWLGSHAINVLILLSPWGAIDAGLKAARTALLGLVGMMFFYRLVMHEEEMK